MSEVDLLMRHHALCAAALDGDLSKSDVKVFAILDEHSNKEGIAWPALSTLAALTEMSARHVSRSLRKLRVLGFLQVVESGTRLGRSTRHRITGKGIDQLRRRIADWRAGRHSECDTIGSEREGALPMLGDPLFPSEGLRVLPVLGEGIPSLGSVVVPNLVDEPPTESARKGRDEVVGVGSGRRAFGPSLAPPSGEEFQRFWSAYPKRMNANDAEDEFRRQVDSGVQVDQIVDGAKRYAEYCNARHSDQQYIKFAKNFLKGQHWRDEFKLPSPLKQETSSQSPRKNGKKKSAGKIVGAGTRKSPSPEEKEKRAKERVKREQERQVSIQQRLAFEIKMRERFERLEPNFLEAAQLFGLLPIGRKAHNCSEDNRFILNTVKAYHSKNEILGPSADTTAKSYMFAWESAIAFFSKGEIRDCENLCVFEGDDPFMLRVARFYSEREKERERKREEELARNREEERARKRAEFEAPVESQRLSGEERAQAIRKPVFHLPAEAAPKPVWHRRPPEEQTQ